MLGFVKMVLYVFHSGTERIQGPLKSCCISVVFKSVCGGPLLAFFGGFLGFCGFWGFFDYLT